jgi:hypothetical protein
MLNDTLKQIDVNHENTKSFHFFFFRVFDFSCFRDFFLNSELSGKEINKNNAPK